MQAPLGSALLFGAGNRNRTGTDFTPRDFKSLVSTYSTMPAEFATTYGNTFLLLRQAERRTVGIFPKMMGISRGIVGKNEPLKS